MPREFSRRLRVGAEIARLLNELLQFEVKDPRLKDVRVSEVDLSGDLGVARVYYTVLDPEAEIQPIEAALVRAAAFLRSRVGSQLRLRRVPELRFELDQSAREGLRISRLIDDSVGRSENSDVNDS